MILRNAKYFLCIYVILMGFSFIGVASGQTTVVNNFAPGPYSVLPVLNSNACVDVNGDSTSDGTVIQSYGCNGTQAQIWTFLPVVTGHSSGYQIVGSRSGSCLSVSGRSVTDGGRIELDRCLGNGQTSQLWQVYTVGSTYEFVSMADGLCLDLTNGVSSNGNQLQQWDCGQGSDKNQLWKVVQVSAEGTPNGAMPIGPYGLHPVLSASTCLDVRGASQANGTPVQAYTCNGTAAQIWSLVPVASTVGSAYQVVAANSNACLDTNNGSKNGSLMYQTQCLGASQLTQLWQAYPFGSSYELVSLQTGKCLDLTNGNSSNNTQVQQWDCAQGKDANQLWNLNSVAASSAASLSATTYIPTTTSVQASPASAVTGQTVLISTQLKSGSGTPNGTVSFYDGQTLIGTATLDGNGSASFSTSQLTNGSHSLNVAYAGAGLYLASSSLSVPVNVAQPSIGEQAFQADSLVDSVGVVTHFTYYNTAYYYAFPTVLSELKAAGIRHIRDGDIPLNTLAFVPQFQTLAASGIQTTFTIPLTTTLDRFSLQTFVAATNDVEALEAPNECDAGGNCGGGDLIGVSNVVAFIPQIAAEGRALNLPVLGPSFVNPTHYEVTGDISSNFNYNNLHVYFGGRNPGTAGWGGANAQGEPYGSMQFWIDQAHDDAPNSPIQTTESGVQVYLTSPVANEVPESVAASYIPRTLLLAFNKKIARTFVYEFIEELSSTGWGLLRADLSERPAYVAIKSMLNLLSDPGASFTPGSLNYSLSGGDSTITHTLVQKRDGSFWLILWSEQSSYDAPNNIPTPVASQNVSLNLTGSAYARQVVQFNAAGTTSTQAVNPTQALTIPITDQVTMVHITPP